MSRDEFASLADAHTEVVRLLSVARIAEVDTVVGFEHRPGNQKGPVTVTVMPAGMTADFWIVRVRCYVATQVGDERAAGLIATLVQKLDHALADAALAESLWTVDFLDFADCWLIASDLQIGREDPDYP